MEIKKDGAASKGTAQRLVLFPVQYHYKKRNQAVAPKGVPWEWIEQFRTRIERNHYQTLERLAQRSGLSPQEIWCGANDRRLFGDGVISEESAFLWLNDRMSEWKQNATGDGTVRR
jgi:hypothetical protein